MIHRKRDWESAQEPCRFALSLSQLGVRGAAGCWEVREGAGSRAALTAGVRCPKVFFGWLSLFFFFLFLFMSQDVVVSRLLLSKVNIYERLCRQRRFWKGSSLARRTPLLLAGQPVPALPSACGGHRDVQHRLEIVC